VSSGTGTEKTGKGRGEASPVRGPGIRAAVAVAAILAGFAILPAGAAFSMLPFIDSVQVGQTVTISGVNTENGTTFLFLTGPGLDGDGVMLTNTSATTKNGSYDTAKVTDYAWKFAWNTSLPGVNLDEGGYVIYAATDPYPRSSLTGRRYVAQMISFRGRLFPATPATTAAPTPVPTWAPAPPGSEVHVSSAPSDDYPGRSDDGNYIVYEAVRGEDDSDIYLYNISDGNTTAVATGPALQKSPSYSGGRVVYSASEVVKFQRTDADLYLYDITTGKTTRLTLPGDQLSPRISGNIIAWQDESPGKSSVDVMLHDLATNVTVKVPAKGRAYLPDISGRRVTWLDDPNAPAVYLYDIVGKSVRGVLNRTGIKGTPALEGARITWADTRDDYDQISVLDIATGTRTQLTTDDSNHFTPAISGDRVVWVDFRNGNRDIYLYDLAAGEETAVTTSVGQQVAPQIAGCTVAWADDRDGGSYDVYYERLAGCTPPPAQASATLEPEVTPAPVTETTIATTRPTTRATPVRKSPAATTTPIPTTTSAPGFGALPALAGLAALAVLIPGKK